MMKLVFDIETNGLLDTISEVHCIVLKDIGTQEVIVVENEKAVSLLEKADMIIGHNIIKFDLPVLEKFYSFKPKGKTFDTIVATRLLYPDIRDEDFKRKNFPRNMLGRHALSAWGVRVGKEKQDFESDWKEFTPQMLEYCKNDVEVTHALYNMIQEKGYSESAMTLEHTVAELIAKQQFHGFTFDKVKAEKLYSQLNADCVLLKDELQNLFPPVTKRVPFLPKVNNATRGYVKGQIFYKKITTTFNPSSRQHIADRLIERYQWKPKEFTPDGKPKLDDSVLSLLPYSEAKILCKHFLLEKRLAQLATGKCAWLKMELHGKIHHNCNTNSTVTARASHSFPNLGQVPSVAVPYGKECRELFTVPKGKKLVGIDVAGLEVRMLAHFLSRFDEGEYAKIVLDGDIHEATRKMAGLESRDVAKRFYYCFLYGGGIKKIAFVTGKSYIDAKRIKTRFLNNLPALNKLLLQVQSVAERGYLVGLDKRHIKVRSVHAALNTLLQSSGALVCKQWLVEFDKLTRKYLNAQQVVWVHDEIQIECEEKDANDIGELAVQAITKSGEHFNLRLPLTGGYKVGENWSETH